MNDYPEYNENHETEDEVFVLHEKEEGPVWRPEPESEDDNRLNAESSEPVTSERENSAETPEAVQWEAYRFEAPSAYADASYIESDEASPVPRNYYSGQSGKEKQKKGGLKAAAVVAACLACAVIGGIAGGAGANLFRDSKQTEVAEEVRQPAIVWSMPANASAVENSPAPVTTTVSPVAGQELSATDIYYNLAINQVVGITTEITTTNRWGYTSAGAVKGSGFIISEDGYILTNYHVIEDAVKGGYDIQVLTYDGTEYIATVVGYEESNDVAVLKIDATGLSAVAIGDSDAVLVGEPVYAVGNPLGELEYTMTDGIVSARDREIRTSESGQDTTISMFQISAAINNGNSGGPIYNSRGEVIGIATAKYASSGVEGLGFAIPINDAVAIASDLITDGYVRGKAYMGIEADTVTSYAIQYYGLVEGANVKYVNEGSCAEKAGLQVSDIIVALGEQEVKSREDLLKARNEFHAGDTTTLRVFRSGEYLDLTITFDEATPNTQTVTPNQDTQTRENDDPYGSYDNYNGYGGYDSFYDYFYDFFGGNPFSW